MSFAAIAARLGLRRSRDAYDSFYRALQSSDASAKPGLILEEQTRLDVLEKRIRSRDAADTEKMEHRLRALERMRERLSSTRGD